MRSASTPWLAWCSASCGTLVRQLPKASSVARVWSSVAMLEDGRSEPAGGHTSSSSTLTV
ncbi:hypothetical protein [Janibacter hoylei]|uniref:hypothetical protein n=1 Tax=Janibacter hoylei TaxID=364298 RepID=UPI001EE678BC|nr:hypothetical protein [Janibacter hoylei]